MTEGDLRDGYAKRKGSMIEQAWVLGRGSCTSGVDIAQLSRESRLETSKRWRDGRRDCVVWWFGGLVVCGRVGEWRR